MHINITLDKSTFQMLSYPELQKLSSYYKHNIAPILVMEIMGDIKKETSVNNKPSEERVKEFAKKLFPTKSIINSYYRNLIKAELMGKPTSFDGRPQVNVEKIVEAEDGSKGFVLQETEEEKSIYKWKVGNFSEADKELSVLWRAITTPEDLLKNLQKSLERKKEGENIKNLEELKDKVENVLNNYDLQDGFLSFMIDNYGEEEIDGIAVFKNYGKAGRPLLKDYMPYVTHCLKVDLLFYYGLMHRVIGTRPTNKVDLEYLYYLPFCNVFTSNDKLHKQLAPMLIRADQRFIVGQELKDDLKSIVQYLENVEPELKKKHRNKPPILKSSLTFQLWEKYFDYPNSNSFNREMSEKDIEYMKKQIDKFEKAAKGESIQFEEGENEQFIVRQTQLSMDDDCFCGSGMAVIQCCLTEEQFKKNIIKPNNPK